MKSSLKMTLLRVWYDFTKETDLGSSDLLIGIELDKLALIIYCDGIYSITKSFCISSVCDSAAALSAFNLL